MLTTIVKIFGSIYIITWVLTMVSYAYFHFRIVLLEKYWNSASEEEFIQKIKTLLLDVNPNMIIFSNRNLMYKLNYVYSTMSHLEKNKFRVSAFKNGVKPRLRKIIEKYY
jgi:hypothetical protein